MRLLQILFLLVCFACTQKKEAKQIALCCEKSSNSKAALISNLSNSQDATITRTLITEEDTAQVANKLIAIPGGTYMQGSNGDHWSLAREFPQHRVTVDAFFMQEHEVTNAEFARFVTETGYKTTAELPVDWEQIRKELPPGTPKPAPEALLPGSMVFVVPENLQGLSNFSQWWRWVQGADWRHPQGPGSNIKGKDNHPVVQLSFEDVQAYANWAGLRLPTEAEWEWAARGGLLNETYPWGKEHVGMGKPKCNYWTGEFPMSNTQEDGFYYTAPVKSYKPNGYGLFDMAGNVWEMCSDKMDVDYYKFLASTNKDITNPKGPSKSNYPADPMASKRVVRGGSYLCNDSYCSSYRVSARMANSEDTGMCHIGFRLVMSGVSQKL